MAFPSGWLYKKKLSVDHSVIGSTLLNFPVLVDKNILKEAVDSTGNPALSGGGDLRASSDAAGTVQLPIEIVHCVPDPVVLNQILEIYVKLPTVSSSSDTVFYVWWGNVSATQPVSTDPFGSQAVWNSDYLAVWHLSSLNDSTANGKTLTPTGDPITAVGIVGGGNGYSANASAPWNLLSDTGNTELSGTTTGTVEAWQVSYDQGHDNRIARTGTSTDQFVLRNDRGEIDAYVNASDPGDTVSIGEGDWAFAACSYNGATRVRFFGDGISISSFQFNPNGFVSGPFVTDSGYEISNADGGFFLDGIADEVRFSKVTRSTDWVTASYINQLDTKSFYVFPKAVTATIGAQAQQATFQGTVNFVRSSFIHLWNYVLSNSFLHPLDPNSVPWHGIFGDPSTLDNLLELTHDDIVRTTTPFIAGFYIKFNICLQNNNVTFIMQPFGVAQFSPAVKLNSGVITVGGGKYNFSGLTSFGTMTGSQTLLNQTLSMIFYSKNGYLAFKITDGVTSYDSGWVSRPQYNNDLLLICNNDSVEGTFFQLTALSGEQGLFDTEVDDIYALPIVYNSSFSFFLEPESQTVDAGADVTLTAGAVQECARPLFYQWKKNGVNLLGETDQVLLLPSVTNTDSGNYVLQASDGFTTANSSTAVVLINSTISAEINGTPFELVEGNPFTLTWTSTGGNISITIDQGIGTVGPSGTLVVYPTRSKTYTLTVIGSTGTATAATSVVVYIGVLKISNNSTLLSDELRIYSGNKNLQEYSEYIRGLMNS